ncbi:hypothetical protein NPS01_04540 [Nocardioides psychrotolerans]|uniref:Aminoglycoside-2''-adenylyltransferase n=1 Tax=Nocardioides psychrotolerans TaxID=1005945 RepID=A0A1I3CKI4_9ACTN|nr:hypothetical protein [Nocardioides psychrotolerans]GEP36791.1 hypothetical protein NPS01_04540 [Nocardioides psychrotolerans]SFH74992.1 hypothetical protein SAMN05216561_102104 [Nocardioides psychrotolerans]
MNADQPPEMDDAEFLRWHGAWEPLTPSTIGAFMAGFDRPWWVVGGWSIEAFTGVAREHEDLDVSMLTCDAPAFRDFLGERWTPWVVGGSMGPGGMRPYRLGGPDVDREGQLWVRRNAGAPWVLDVPLTPDTGGLWTNKRWHAHVAPVADVTWVGDDGVPYLRPEVTIMMKARLDRPKDRADLDACWPLLGDAERAWARDTIALAHPAHPWLGLF